MATTREASPTSVYVERFAALMEQKLSENRHKGGREGWRNERVQELLWRLQEEANEVDVAVRCKRAPDEIARECADVANFAMFIADRVGGLGE